MKIIQFPSVASIAQENLKENRKNGLLTRYED